MKKPKISISKPYKSRSLVFPNGVWKSSVEEFQYDMTLDAKLSYHEARKEFLRQAHEAYERYDDCKEQYLKWLLKIQ